MGRWTEELRELQAMIPEVSDTLTGPPAPELVAAALCHSLVATPQPIPPIRPGWLVAYRDQRGALCGGCDDRQRGTVEVCRWNENKWTLCLTDGQEIPLSIVLSVGPTDEAGRIIAAWTVREHGYDGEGPVTRGGENRCS
ncbi:MAG: hypothetical protein E8D47_12190 [Nitrospira sp.]|nr:MAG: hypothetical protein E8D47_12190 [Nitrospira sp.]